MSYSGATWCFYLLTAVMTLLVTSGRGDDLCARCETSDMKQLRQYYETLQVTSVSFRQFVYNLLETMDERPSLAPVRHELLTIVHRFDDCVRTCEIPFTKREISTPLLVAPASGKRWNKAGSFQEEKKSSNSASGVWQELRDAGKRVRWSKELLDDLTLNSVKRW